MRSEEGVPTFLEVLDEKIEALSKRIEKLSEEQQRDRRCVQRISEELGETTDGE